MAFLAADPLVAAGIPLARLSEPCPGVDPFKVEVRRAPLWLRAVVPTGVEAIAFPRVIYLFPSAWNRPKRGLAPLVAHELAHVSQWRHHGRMGMIRRYLADYLRGRRHGSHWEAYRAIGFEAEARAAAALVCGTER